MNSLDKLTRDMADMERRLRIMEGTQRSGLGSIQAANSVNPAAYTSYPSWSNLGGEAPEITMLTGSRVIFLAQARVSQVGTPTTAAALKTSEIAFGVAVDSTDPTELGFPRMYSTLSPAAVTDTGNVSVWGWLPVVLSTSRSDIEPGEHTFKMKFAAAENNPSGTDHPSILDMSLIVIPLGFA